MTRNLRKRHLAIWMILGFIMIFLIAYARNNVPVFAGDKPEIIHRQ